MTIKIECNKCGQIANATSKEQIQDWHKRHDQICPQGPNSGVKGGQEGEKGKK